MLSSVKKRATKMGRIYFYSIHRQRRKDVNNVQ